MLQPEWFVAFILSVFPSTQSKIATVVPTVETAPVPASGDSAEDVALWIHPTDRALSTVITTAKNLGLLAGLLLAAADTAGAPSLRWRAQRALRKAQKSVTASENS